MQRRTKDSEARGGWRTAILLGILLLAGAVAILLLRDPDPAPSQSEASSAEMDRDAKGERRSRQASSTRGVLSSRQATDESKGSSLETVQDGRAEDAPATLVVRVLDASTDQPLSRERIDTLLRGSDVLRPEALTTDDDGVFILEAVLPGAYTLRTRHEDFLPDVRLVQVTAPSASPDEHKRAPDLEVRLVVGEALVGEVVDGEGRPLPRAAVRLMLTEGDSLDSARASTTADGSFLVRGLRNGTWRLSAGKDGYRRASLSVEIPSPGPVRLELPEDQGFTVLVSDEQDAPVVSAQVRVLQRTDGLPGGRSLGRTDTAGQAVLHGLPANAELSVLLEVSHEAYLPVRERVRVADLENGPYSLHLSGGRVVAGTVLDSGGAPVRGAEIRLMERGKADGRTLKTISTGKFRFNRIPPGEYELTAVTREQGAGRIESLQVGSPAMTDELQIVVEAGDGEVAGGVAQPDGKPVRLCPVELKLGPHVGADSSESGTRSGLVLRTITAADGSFRFAGLLPSAGTACTITAGGGKYTPTSDVSCRIGQKDVEIVVESLGSIRGNFSPEGKGGSFSIVLTREEDSRETPRERRFNFSSHDGWFQLRRISPGRYTISVVIEGEIRAISRGVEVLPGRETGPVMMRPGG